MRIIDKKIRLYQQAVKAGLGDDISYLKRRLREFKKQAKKQRENYDYALYFKAA